MVWLICSLVRLIDGLVDYSIGWVGDCVVHCLISWFLDWFWAGVIDWLIWLIYWWIDRLVVLRYFSWIDWLIGWLIIWLIALRRNSSGVGHLGPEVRRRKYRLYRERFFGRGALFGGGGAFFGRVVHFNCGWMGCQNGRLVGWSVGWWIGRLYSRLVVWLTNRQVTS